MKKRLESQKNMLKKRERTNMRKDINKSSYSASKAVKLFRFTNNEAWIKTYISRIINI